MAMPISVEVYRTEDWCKVYVDGKLRYDGHGPDVYFWTSLLSDAGVSVTSLYIDDPDEFEAQTSR